MKIAMIGAGYVGLVSGVCFSDFGHDVICVEKDVGKLARLQTGEVPIYEPGLDELMTRNVEAGRLHFTDDLAHAVRDADAVFIAVGTPTRRGDGYPSSPCISWIFQEVPMTQEKMSPLRARMIEDMRIRGMAETSQKAHIRALSFHDLPRTQAEPLPRQRTT